MTEREQALMLMPTRPAKMTPADAAARVCALFDLTVRLHEFVEAQCMECCHRMQQAGPEEFERLVATTPLSLAKAEAMAAAWSVAKGNREVMDLAASRPSETLRLIGDVVEVVDDIDEAGRAVLELFALPKRQRVAELRKLIEAKETKQRPEDRARIDSLEDENDTLRAELVAKSTQAPATWKSVHARMSDAASLLEDVFADVKAMPVRPMRQGERLVRECDAVVAQSDAIEQMILALEDRGGASE